MGTDMVSNEATRTTYCTACHEKQRRLKLRIADGMHMLRKGGRIGHGMQPEQTVAMHTGGDLRAIDLHLNVRLAVNSPLKFSTRVGMRSFGKARSPHGPGSLLKVYLVRVTQCAMCAMCTFSKVFHPHRFLHNSGIHT